MTVAADAQPASPPVGRCAPAAEQRGDQRYGTAAPVPRWLLVEQPGPWGRDALTQSRFAVAAAAELGGRAAAARVRVLLIRRPGRGATSTRRRWAFVDSRPGHEGSWWGRYDDERELLGVPLDGTAGAASATPIYLVCTHGRHDPCCALRGRPVAAALAAQRPEQTWECSHVGGDRFAANLVVLPHGLYYGQVGAAAALDVVRAYESGSVVPTWLRGRSSLAAPVQAAQHHARAILGERSLTALLPLDVEVRPGGRWRVLMAWRSGAVDVEVRARLAAPALLTCASGRPEPVRVFDLVRLRVPDSARRSATDAQAPPGGTPRSPAE